MVTNQRYISQPFTKNRPLKVLLCHFQYLNFNFKFSFIRSLKIFLSKWQFFHKIYYIKHGNVETMNKLRMAKKIFQLPVFHKRLTYITTCNFKSMKSFVDLNSLFSKIFCYITWYVIPLVQMGQWMTCKRGLYVKSYCFFQTIAQRFKNYKLITLICNHKAAAIRSYFRKTFFVNFRNYSKSIFGGGVVQ